MGHQLLYVFGILLIGSFEVQGYEAKSPKYSTLLSRYAPIVREFLICPYTSGIKLDCGLDGDIEVNFAFYGREGETDVCVMDPNNLLPPPKVCYIDGDEEILYNKCNGKNTCGIFVNPEHTQCKDSMPYVFIRHTCTNFVAPSLEASSTAPYSEITNIFDRSLSTHFETQWETQPWLKLTLNRSMIISRVSVHFHDDDDDEYFIHSSKIVVQTTFASEITSGSHPISTPNARTCIKKDWFGTTYNCFTNSAKDAIVIFSKVPGALRIKEVVITTVPEFVDIA